MAQARALRRLLRVRDLEEEQCRMAVAATAAELNRLKSMRETALSSGFQGWQMATESAHSGELAARLGAVEQTCAAARVAQLAETRIAQAEAQLSTLREAFLAKRLERRQAETLLKEAEARQAGEEARRMQRAADDWYGARKRGTQRLKAGHQETRGTKEREDGKKRA